MFNAFEHNKRILENQIMELRVFLKKAEIENESIAVKGYSDQIERLSNLTPLSISVEELIELVRPQLPEISFNRSNKSTQVEFTEPGTGLNRNAVIYYSTAMKGWKLESYT